MKQKILDDYKKYDYLNGNLGVPFVKILVSYFKPSFLFKSDILTPIQLGRMVEEADSKNGYLSEEDRQWLHENCIGDDGFEGNISHVNRRIGFFTGTYWACKNYEKLGDPAYFGSFGYRRLMDVSCLREIEKYDAILPKKKQMMLGYTIKKQFISAHGLESYKLAIKAIEMYYSSQLEIFHQYLACTEGFFDEIYIFRKNIFFDFCNWIYPLISFLLSQEIDSQCSSEKKLTYQDYCQVIGDSRDVAYIIERLTGFYCYMLTLTSGIKYKQVAVRCLASDEDVKRKRKMELALIRARFVQNQRRKQA